MRSDFYDALGFLIELFIAEACFLWKEPKKTYFPIRLILGGFLCFLFAIFAFQFPFQGWTNLIRYTAVFLITLPTIDFCFELNSKEILFYGVASYGVQHLTYNICYIIFADFLVSYSYDSLPHYFITFLLSGVMCFVLSYYLRQNKKYQLANSTLICISAVILIITIVIGYIPVLYIPVTEIISRTVCSIYSSICCLLALSLQFGLLAQNRWKQEASMMEQLLKMDRRQYELTKNTIDLINNKSHDLKKQISLIREVSINPSTQNALSEIEDAISNYDNTAKTGNKTLDLILSQKLMQASNNNIVLSYMVDGHSFDFMDTIDLFSLFGNILDNAIESVLQLSNTEHRVIDLSALPVKQMLIIRCDNYFEHELIFENGIPRTSKEDSDYHGFGLKSIQMTIEKYHGSLSISTEENIFHLTILLPQGS